MEAHSTGEQYLHHFDPPFGVAQRLRGLLEHEVDHREHGEEEQQDLHHCQLLDLEGGVELEGVRDELD